MAPSFTPPPSPTRPSKVVTQREYREKDRACFNTLRDTIREVTGEEPQTRLEVLKKATELLSVILEIRRQRANQVQTPSGSSNVPSSASPAGAAPTHLGHPAQWQPFHFPQGRHPTAGLDAYNTAAQSSSGHQHQFRDSSLDSAGYPDYDEEWEWLMSNFPQS